MTLMTTLTRIHVWTACSRPSFGRTLERSSKSGLVSCISSNSIKQITKIQARPKFTGIRMSCQANGGDHSSSNGHGNMSKTMVAFGNPLLDIVINITPEEEDSLLEKYQLQRYVGQEADTEALMKELNDKRKHFVAGGCAFNTCRVFRWLEPSNSIRVLFFGSVGRDPYRERLESIIKNERVESRFFIQDSLPTGHCVALVCGQERTMVASLGAASSFTNDNLQSMNCSNDLSSANVCYITSFFAVHSWDVTLSVARACRQYNTVLAFNLNGEYLWQDSQFLSELSKLLPFVNIIFGNKNEFKTLVKTAKAHSFKSALIDGIEKTLGHASDSEKELSNNQHLCTVIISDGPDPIICAEVDSKSGDVSQLEVIPVPPMASDEIVDTIGAGDSFVSGYLQAFLAEQSRRSCVDRGIYASQEIIRQIGTQLPTSSASTLCTNSRH